MPIYSLKSGLTIRIIIAVILGLLLGPLLGSHTSFLGEVGKGIILLIKIGATPLLFFTILSSVLKTNLSWKKGSKVFVIAGINATLALAIGLSLSNIFKPGEHFEKSLVSTAGNTSIREVRALEPGLMIKNLIPESFLVPFLKNDVLSIVFVALLFGFALKKVRIEQKISPDRLSPAWVETGLLVVEKILSWIVKLIPIAVFSVVAKSINEYGFSPLRGLIGYLGVALGGLALQVVVVYSFWIVRVSKISLKKFFQEAKEPVVYAIGVNSSLATLPLTFRALRNLGISQESQALGAGIATNFNNDGILLYEAMAVLFIAQAHGIHLDLGQQIVTALSCVVAGMGIAGVPEAGFIALSIVLVTVGLPTEYLPLLLAVDWVIARGRSAVNVLSDMVLSIVLDRWKTR